MRNVRERATVNEGGIAFQGLHQVGEEGVPEEQGHRTGSVQIIGTNGVPVKVGADNDLAEARPQISVVACEDEDGHHFARGGDVETVLPNVAVGWATEPNHDLTQGAVVEVHHARPADAGGVQATVVAVLDVVVNHRRKQVVRRGHRVQVAREMQVDLLHRQHLRAATSCRSSLDAKHRAHGRLPDHAGGRAADAVQRLRQANGGHRFPFAEGRGVDRGHEHEAALRPVQVLLNARPTDLGDVASVGLESVRGQRQLPRDGRDVLKRRFAGDFQVGGHEGLALYDGLSMRRLAAAQPNGSRGRR